MSLTYGLTEACSQVTTTPARRAGRRRARPPGRRCSARACAAPTTARSSSPGRPSRPRALAPRRLAAHRRPRRARRARAAARDRAQGRHDRQRRRERRAERGRGGARSAPRRARGGRRRAARRAVGRGRHGDRRRARRAPRPTATSCARTAPRALAPYKVPKRVRAARRAAAAHALGQAAAHGSCAMSFDANAHRDASLQGWEEAAAGWVRSQELLREFGAPVSHWMIDAVAPQPGQRVLELAAGLGETGLLAAELVAPVGGVIISDQAEAMLDGARERAAELGLAQRRVPGAQRRMDRPAAWPSVDVVLCRWGYMLMADPGAALGETRRVLRTGRARRRSRCGTAIERNPWAALPGARAARARPVAGAGARHAPGPVRARRRRARARAARAGRLRRGRASSRSSCIAATRASTSSGRRRSTSRAASTTRCSARPQAEIEEIRAARRSAPGAVRGARRRPRHPRAHARRRGRAPDRAPRRDLRDRSGRSPPRPIRCRA